MAIAEAIPIEQIITLKKPNIGKRRPRIYVAGALSTLAPDETEDRSPSKIVVDYLSNVGKMLGLAFGVLNGLRAIPYIPALDLLLGIWSTNMTEEQYRVCSMSFLEVCDAIYVTSESKGVLSEVERAKELWMPVLRSHTEVQDWIRKWDNEE